MFTNKALTELKYWANAAHEGQGELARRHLQQFIHIGVGFTASNEFQQRYKQVHGQPLDPLDFERTGNCWMRSQILRSAKLHPMGCRTTNPQSWRV